MLVNMIKKRKKIKLKSPKVIVYMYLCDKFGISGYEAFKAV
jgi:hypothetical protein